MLLCQNVVVGQSYLLRFVGTALLLLTHIRLVVIVGGSSTVPTDDHWYSRAKPWLQRAKDEPRREKRDLTIKWHMIWPRSPRYLPLPSIHRDTVHEGKEDIDRTASAIDVIDGLSNVDRL